MILKRIGIATATVAALTAGIATSAYGTIYTYPNDPTFTPNNLAVTDVKRDLVGVGSDTTMIAMHLATDGTVAGTAPYNAGRTIGRVASFQAADNPVDDTSTITLRTGTDPVSRVLYNGSGNGKKALFGATNNPLIDFARSSSALSSTEVAGDLWASAFAKDGMKIAARAAGTDAPNAIVPIDLVNIYNGTYTTWGQLSNVVDTNTLPIHALLPQRGSGTFSFFDGELKKIAGLASTAVFPYSPSIPEVQEHDPAPIAADPDAIEPFSTGRAQSQPSIKLLTNASSFTADRALYNVVRGADLNSAVLGPKLEAAFGATGWLCSKNAWGFINAAGFQQLSLASAGGACGTWTQVAVTNFALATTPPAGTWTTAINGSLVHGQANTIDITNAVVKGVPANTTATIRLDNSNEFKVKIVNGQFHVALPTSVPAGNHTLIVRFTTTRSSVAVPFTLS